MVWIKPNGNNTTNTDRTIISKKDYGYDGYQVVSQPNDKIRLEWSTQK
jgi:hypothetical protein